jgi:predicted SAM-dependent methyltransferase
MTVFTQFLGASSGRGRKVAKWVYGRWAQSAQIDSYLHSAEKPRLNIGCGANVLAGWMNVDLEGGRHGSIFMDATRAWPLPEGAFDAVLCEHMIEHISKEQGRHLVVEAFRVLKPGGHVRVVTPDLTSMAQLVLEPQRQSFAEYLEFVARIHGKPRISTADALNYIFYDYGHRYIYTADELKSHLDAAGFRQVRETRAGHPHGDVFEGAEGHAAFMGLQNDATEAFALEAEKPSNVSSRA